MKPFATAIAALALMAFGAPARADGARIVPTGATPTGLGGAENFSGQAVVDIVAAGRSGKLAGAGRVASVPVARIAWT